MKTSIVILTLLASANASAWQPYNPAVGHTKTQTVTATPNVFGGHNYRSNGNQIGSSSKNVFGGHNYRDSNYNNIGASRSNVFGGTTYTWSK